MKIAYHVDMTISSFAKIKYLIAVLILAGFCIMSGCQSGRVLPDDSRAPATAGTSPKNEASGSTYTEHFQSEEPPVGGLSPEGEFRWEKYPRPPFSSFKYAPKYVPAAKSSGTAGSDTQSRMTQVLDAKQEFKERLKERREKEAYLAQIRPLIEKLKKELVKVKKEEARFLTENLEFVEKRMSKLTHAIGDIEISAYCLERLDQIEQEKRNPPEGSSDESALEKEKTSLEYDVQFHQWRANRFREIAHQVKDEYESIRMKHHSIWNTQLRRQWQAAKDSLSKGSSSSDVHEKPFDPLDPIDLSEFKEFAQKMISDPKNIESKGVRTFLGLLLDLSVAQYLKQEKNSPLIFKRTSLMDSKALRESWEKRADVENANRLNAALGIPQARADESVSRNELLRNKLIPERNDNPRVPPQFAALGKMYQVGNKLIPVTNDNPRVPPQFAALGNMYQVGNLILSAKMGPYKAQMNQRDAVAFCRNLGPGVHLPTREEYEVVARAMIFNGQYDRYSIPDMSGNRFWSSSMLPQVPNIAFYFDGNHGSIDGGYRSAPESVRCGLLADG